MPWIKTQRDEYILCCPIFQYNCPTWHANTQLPNISSQLNHQLEIVCLPNLRRQAPHHAMDGLVEEGGFFSRSFYSGLALRGAGLHVWITHTTGYRLVVSSHLTSSRPVTSLCLRDLFQWHQRDPTRCDESSQGMLSNLPCQHSCPTSQ
jgi:hypothetical protein